MFQVNGEKSTNITIQEGLLYNPNCEASRRCNHWLGALNKETRVGCGINVLRFMGEIDYVNAVHGLTLAKTGEGGTPFRFMVMWFNRKLRNLNVMDYKIYEHVQDIRTPEKLTQYFNVLDRYLPPNSCTLVKLNRNKDVALRPRHPESGRALTPGHYVLMSKEDGKIWTYEPYISTPGKCNKREYKGVSTNFFNAYTREGYISVSMLIIQKVEDPRMDTSIDEPPSPMGEDPRMDTSIGGGDSVVVGNMFEDMIDALENSIECAPTSTSTSTSGGWKRKKRNTKRNTKGKRRKNKKSNKRRLR